MWNSIRCQSGIRRVIGPEGLPGFNHTVTEQRLSSEVIAAVSITIRKHTA